MVSIACSNAVQTK